MGSGRTSRPLATPWICQYILTHCFRYKIFTWRINQLNYNELLIVLNISYSNVGPSLLYNYSILSLLHENPACVFKREIRTYHLCPKRQFSFQRWQMREKSLVFKHSRHVVAERTKINHQMSANVYSHC